MSSSLEILKGRNLSPPIGKLPSNPTVYCIRRKGAAVLLADRGCFNMKSASAENSMRVGPRIPILSAAVACLLCMLPQIVHSTGAEPAKEPPVDPAPCVAAAAANDDDKIVAECGALADNEKTARADRIKALIARGGAFGRKDQIDRAIGDYNTVLWLDPALADIYNARGELWRKKGDRPRALADFGAAIKLNPDHLAAKGNYRSLARELERLGALIAVAGKPSFNCATARRPVEKAICANPELANLDREINAANTKVVRDATADSPRAGRALQREQDEFVARRNASFGRPDYDLQKAMRERLDHLLAVVRH
jgi:tetratricopeptide (TPR) repeat protein